MQHAPYHNPMPESVGKWLAAAIILLVLSVAGLIYDNRKREEPPQRRQAAAADKGWKTERPSEIRRQTAAPSRQTVVLKEPQPASAEVTRQYAAARSHIRAGDWSQAVPFLEAAARAGYWRAQNNLGVAYLEGKGVRRDDETGCEWMGRAAAQYVDFHMVENLRMCLAETFGGDYQQTWLALQPWAEQGHVYAQWALANVLLYSRGDVPQDHRSGIRWLGRAAREEAAAMKQLAACFGLRSCAHEYYNPVVSTALDAVLSERGEAGWWKRLAAKFGKRSTAAYLSDAEKREAEQYIREWRHLDNRRLAEAAVEEGAGADL